MKARFMKAALLVVLAGVTLSAGAKPAEVRQWNNPVSIGLQDGNLIVALGPTSKKVLSTIPVSAPVVIVDIPISAARPK